jgi:hypothetical protein
VLHIGVGAHGVRGVQVEAPHEHGQAAKQNALRIGQHCV